MSQTAELVVKLRQVGGEQLTQLAGKLNNVGKQAAAASTDFKELAADLKKWQAESIRSINNLKGYANAWREIANSVDVASQEFKEATAEANKLDRQLNKIQGKGGGLTAGTKIAGTIASASIFGGPLGGLGAAAGAGIGAITGAGALTTAIAGGAAGAAAGGVAAAAGAASDYAAQIGRLRIALQGVSKDQEDYRDSLNFVRKASNDYLQSVADTTINYTRLQASVRGAGKTTADTQNVFKGLSAAVIATGGDSEKLNAVMLATSQVFSKGKVSAEELRGQIGERLPGAFTLFADAIGKTPQELDKMLDEGQVTLEDFIKFAENLYQRYGETAKIIGDSPFAASLRAKIAFDNFKLAAGQALLPVVTGFQNLATVAFNSLTRVIEGQTAWQKSIDQTLQKITKMAGGIQGITNIVSNLIKTLVVLGSVQAGVFVASNITTFANAVRGLLGVMRTLLSIERLLLAATTARAAALTLIAGLTTGATKGKVLGAIVGGGAGIAATFAIGKIIEDISKSVIDTVSGLTGKIKVPSVPFGKDVNIGTQLGAGADEASKKKKKELVDLTKEELDLIEQINKHKQEGNDLEAAFVQFELNRIQTALKLDAQEIGTNEAKARGFENQTNLVKAVEMAFRGFGDEIIKGIDLQEQMNRAIEDAEIKAGLLTGEKARQLLIDRQLAEFMTQYPDASAEAIGKYREAISTVKKELTETEELGKSIIQTFADGLGNAIMSVFDKAQNLNELLSNILKQVANLLINFGIRAGLKGLFPSLFESAMGNVMTERGPMPLKKYARGGITSGPVLSLAGEAGPEAIVPLPDGRSIPVRMVGAGSGGANVVVNVDANGSSVQGDGPTANQLGKVIGAAVQAEIVKQQRPGGLLSGTR